MIIRHWKKELFTVPNLLSFIRIMLIPVYVIIYLRASERSHYMIAGIIMAASCITDIMDGFIARHFHMTSALGKFLDPLADKMTQFAVLICLVVNYQILWYIVALFVIKELFQLIAGIITFMQGRMLKGALISGKISTAILFISLIAMVMFELPLRFIRIIVILDAAVLLIAFGNYCRTYCLNTSMIEDIKKDI